MTRTSRRLFLQKSALATSGLALLSAGTVQAFSNTSPFKGYNPYAENKTDLRTTFMGHHLEVKGTIYLKNGLLPASNTTVEVWHLSPNSTKYRNRAKLTTNKNGEYRFITDFPNKEEGKNPRIHFKISTATTSYFTELIVGTTGAHITSKHWEENQLLKEKLFPASQKQIGSTITHFNISI